MELKYLSEWEDQLQELVAEYITNLKEHFNSPRCKVVPSINLILKTGSACQFASYAL